jgi:phosphoribosylformimino-5-aminoimidazole carboxamide ribotide isomerase
VILYPAIDILGGNAVRLTKGDFAAKKLYDEDPLAAAATWVEAGARALHVVDLDGARAGVPTNLDHLRRIAERLGVPIQFGGGLRSLGAIGEAIEAGAARVILGTGAFTDPILLGRALEEWPGKILVSVDVRGGRVATEGWTETVDGRPEQVLGQLAARGASEVIYTNVDRDGMLEGPDLEEVRRMARAAEGRLIYSGGIARLADLEGLAGLHEERLQGVIVGKALYERRFTVEQAIDALKGAASAR